MIHKIALLLLISTTLVAQTDCSIGLKKILEVPKERILRAQVNYAKIKQGNKLTRYPLFFGKTVLEKIKLSLMEINRNYRPIFYINTDEASYAKIFLYIESKATGVADIPAEGRAVSLNDLEAEIKDWLIQANRYPDDINNLLQEVASNEFLVKELKKMKPTRENPISVQLNSFKESGELKINDVIETKEQLMEYILKFKGKNKHINGSFLQGQGLLDERELKQAILLKRLRYLDREINLHIAEKPDSETIFSELREQIKLVLDKSELNPKVSTLFELEWKEMNEEYKTAFQKNYEKSVGANEKLQKFIDSLSPRYRKKLGIDDAKKWSREVLQTGKWGVLFTGVGTLGGGVTAVGFRFWEFINYEADSRFNITNAKSNEDFYQNLKNYLREKYPANLISRLELLPNGKFTLKNYNEKKSKERELVLLLNHMIERRKKYLAEEEMLNKKEKELQQALEKIQVE